MRTRTLAGCAAAALAVWTTALTAQDKPAEPEKPKAVETKPRGEARVRSHVEQIVEIKNRELLGEMQKLATAGYGVGAFRSEELGILVVSGPPDAVAEAVAAIRRFDVPRPKGAPDRAESKMRHNADVTGWLLLARNEGGGGSPVPAALSSVVAQLKEHTSYKSYEVLETMSLRVRNDGGGEVSGILPSVTSGVAARTYYRLNLGAVRIDRYDAGPAAVSFGHVQLNVEVGLPAGTGADVQYKNLEIKTGIDMREGQKAVVGKTTLDGTSGSLILVLTAKVLE
jgi:hypothetical protein